MKKPLLVVIIIFSFFHVSAVNWVQRNSLPTIGRQCAVGFSITDYGYVGCGRSLASSTLFKDFWQYNPANDTWTQMADFGGTARYAASYFVIDRFGYVGLGADQYIGGYHFTDDFWKYDPTLNSWTQVADFGGNARYAAPAFSIGVNGYVGTGYDQVTPNYQDFWQYNALTDTWMQKANYPGGACEEGVGFAAASYGYFGTGWNSSAKSDFYKYDPIADTWSQIASFPYTLTSGTAFVIGNTAYVGLGSTSYPAINFKKQWWTYDIISNTWLAFADLGTTGRYNSISFAIGEIGYAGLGGVTNWSQETNDFWSWENVGTNNLPDEHIGMNIYPNPSNGNIILQADFTGKLTIKIFNYNSQCVYEEIVENNISENSIHLNLEHLSKGLYFVRVISKNAIGTSKLVLN